MDMLIKNISLSHLALWFYTANISERFTHIHPVNRGSTVILVYHTADAHLISRFSIIIITTICRRNLLNVIDFLKRPNASELVSGTRDRVNLHDKFRNAVEAHLPPGTIDRLMEKASEKKKAEQKKVSFWDSVLDSQAGGFKFGF